MNWRDARVSDDATHHVIEGVPCYERRFDSVLSFHEPGLAAARNGTEAWHIRIDGTPAYFPRFRATFGFYEDRAAVVGDAGWFHVRPDASALSNARYRWVGNYQSGRCTVRGVDDSYFHIDREGRPAYAERHLYAGDYRDGRAVVRWHSDGLCGHIDLLGRPAHSHRFLDLDVFHKGFARARDAGGWHHVDRDGRSAYPTRFSNVEPFYNGFALAWLPDGAPVVLDERGVIQLRITRGSVDSRRERHSKLLVLGNIGAGKSTLRRALAEKLGWPSYSIDDCRRTQGDGTPEGELRAWATFVAAARRPGAGVFECTGVGPQIPLLRLALHSSRDRIGVIWVRTPVDECRARAVGRAPISYPDFGVPIDRTIVDLDEPIARAMSMGGTWGAESLGVLDGTVPPYSMIVEALGLVTSWRANEAMNVLVVRDSAQDE